MKKIIIYLSIYIFIYTLIAQEYKNNTKSLKSNNKNEPYIELKDKWDTAQFALVEGGIFLMGSNNEKFDETPAYKVTVTTFLISRFEITQSEWQSIMIGNPSITKGDKYPVNQIRWYQAIIFCNKLSQRDGLAPCYAKEGITNPDYWGKIPPIYSKNNPDWDNITCDWNATGYRLPTEAEWEFAARGGNLSKGYKYSGSDNVDEVAWYEKNSKGKIHEVGTKSPNELGIFDMNGNVSEMCWDWYGNYLLTENRDPVGNKNGFSRVSRGASFADKEQYCTITHRSYVYLDLYTNLQGFRIVRRIRK
jgi:formylglycine-generating enzyme required for sulfatase activity